MTELGVLDLLLLLWAQWLLIWTWLLLRLIPRGELLRRVGEVGPADQLNAVEERSAKRLALAISRAADNGIFRPTCLVQAMALQRWLLRSGIEGARVRVGVRFLGGEFAAHAWVELGKLVLGDLASNVSTFTPLSDLGRPEF